MSDGMTAGWQCSDEILKDFIAFTRMAAEARHQGDLEEYYKQLQNMFIQVDAFIKREYREEIEEYMSELVKAISQNVEPTESTLDMFIECDRKIRMAAQASNLLMKHADVWDEDARPMSEKEKKKISKAMEDFLDAEIE